MGIKLSTLTTKMGSEYVASVVITGLVVVFIALILLVICVSLFGKLFDSINKSKAAKTAKKNDEVLITIEKSKENIPTPVIEDGITDEVVAVITAAIASLNSNVDGVTYCLKSINKARNTSRRAWANAGTIDNTKPF